MTEERKKELAQMCRLEIRRSVTLTKMALADYAYHLAEPVLDVEFSAMVERITDRSVRSDDVALLRELVMEELWPRLRTTHKEHREFCFEAQKSMNRDTIARDAEFAFDIGWRFLLQRAADRLETYPSSWRARITGGKEKFGCCVIFIGFDTDQRGAGSEVDRLLEEIRLRSLSTCEICGGQGRLRLSSVAKTVCDKHVDVLGDIREDDGLLSDPWKWHMHEINDKFSNPEPMMFEENPWVGAVDLSLLEDMDPPVDRDTKYVTDPQRTTALGRRIDDDTGARSGREQELLIEFGFYIKTAVRGAEAIDDEKRGDWVSEEISHWDEYSVAPLSEDDKKWLRGYVLGLVVGRI